MKIIESISFIVLVLLFAWVPITRSLHMFQQNRYELQRYTAWLKSRITRLKFTDGLVILTICVLGVLETSNQWIALCFAIGIFMIWILLLFQAERKKQYIKPLVFTSRVKRQVVVMVALTIVWSLFLININLRMTMVSILGFYGVWVVVYVMHLITLPIEKMVKNKYLNEAKSILKKQNQLTKIGITGSYGKTSSKNVVQAILSEKYYSLMTPASFNTPMGITRTIREHLRPIHEVFVCEMGADHVGDIQELCDFVNPTIGVVTSIGPQHLNTFGSMENIIMEKMQMIEKLPEDGIGILNMDNEHIANYTVKNSCQLIRYGIHYTDGDYKVKDIEYISSGSRFTVVSKEDEVCFETKLLGEHNIANIVAALAISKELGMTWEEMQKAVKQLEYVEHRLELKKINGYTFIDNAFNSNPSGAAMSLEVLKRMPGKRFVITPGMIDLGEQQEQKNQEFGEKMKDHVDVVILVGEKQTKPIMKGLDKSGFDMKQVHLCKTVKEAFSLVYQLATVDDTILLENDLPDAFNN